jgi:hypothetical protein
MGLETVQETMVIGEGAKCQLEISTLAAQVRYVVGLAVRPPIIGKGLDKVVSCASAQGFRQGGRRILRWPRILLVVVVIIIIIVTR